MVVTDVEAKLALLGGKEMYPEKVSPMPWPPVSEETAERLKQVYMSGKWSFYGPEELAFSDEYAKMHDAAYGISNAPFMQWVWAKVMR